MATYYFNATLSYEQYLPFYQGSIKTIQVRDTHGRTIDLPAEHFRPFLTRDGISGFFELMVDQRGKFIWLKRIN